MPWQIGLSGSYKLQSGRNWGRAVSFSLPNLGNQTVRVEPVDANRAPNVHIVDLRFDKSFTLPRSFGRIVGMVDVFNLFNPGTPIVFRTQTQTAAGGPAVRQLQGSARDSRSADRAVRNPVRVLAAEYAEHAE